MALEGVRRWTWIAAACSTLLLGCGRPVLSRDGKLVFQPGPRGASVITANGVEFLDESVVPRPVVRRSADEPWRPATGFLMPADGIWRHTSTAVPVQGRGMLVVLRSSDVLVPSWGGEILLRMDAIAPAAAFPRAAPSVRAPLRLVIVVDGAGTDTMALAGAALEDLGGADRAAIVDATRARPVLPPLPGSHRTLLQAAVERLLAQSPRSRPQDASARDLPQALAAARGWLSVEPSPETRASRHVLVLTDGVGVARGGERLQREIEALSASGARLTAIATDPANAPRLADRRDAVTEVVAPPGEVVLADVMLSIAAVPAPARVVELSSGETALGLYADHMILGEMYAGEARTEVARVMLPPWVPGEPLEVTVTARYRDVASGRVETADAMLHCRYSENVTQIAEARHGDVIAYASALAMVRRLHRAFLGSPLDRIGGVRSIATLQASSLAEMARIQHDPALAAQAEVLSGLLGVMED